jgi:hypothetical protein
MPDASAVEFVIQGTALDGKLFRPGDRDVRLEQIEPKAYRFLLSFARDNELRVRGRVAERSKLAELQRVGDTA